jgi:hypothetical protein
VGSLAGLELEVMGGWPLLRGIELRRAALIG